MSIEEIKQKLKTVNFRQPKYMLPAILYLPLLVTGYFVIGMFTADKAEVPDTSRQTTNYLNDKLPEAKVKGDGIGSKYDNMRNSYGTITDASAVNTVDRNEDEQKEVYESKYSEEELAQLQADAAKQAEQAMQKDAEASRQSAREQEAIKELERALAEARLKGQISVPQAGGDMQKDNDDNNGDGSGSAGGGGDGASGDSGSSDHKPDVELKGKININTAARSKPSDVADASEVVKKVKTSSDYFNTLAANEREPNMIKAIIDENVKAVDGSRVRLRLLDDVEIGEAIVPKGSYLYATMSGFGGQRVKGTVKSVMVYDEIVKINLSLYDADGLEGLYVPESSFRETSKDVASSAMSGSMGISSTSSDNTLEQWGIRAAQNAYSKTASAISKAIKKNRAKLKYGTFVYLINSREIKTK